MTSATHDVPAVAARAALSLPYTHVDSLFIDGAWTPAAAPAATRSPTPPRGTSGFRPRRHR